MLTFFITNKEIILSIIGAFVALTVSKLPDPRSFEGEWYYAPYYAFFEIATTYLTIGSWNKFGLGKLAIFEQHPKLSETPKPMTFTDPNFFKYNENT